MLVGIVFLAHPGGDEVVNHVEKIKSSKLERLNLKLFI